MLSSIGDCFNRLYTRAVQVALELARFDEQMVVYVALHLVARLVKEVVAAVYFVVFFFSCRICYDYMSFSTFYIILSWFLD